MALAGVMRGGAKEKIKEAYEGAWNNAPVKSVSVLPGIIESPKLELVPVAPSSERMWKESEVIDLILANSNKMKEHLRNVVQKHQNKGEMSYGPSGEVLLGVPLFFGEGLEFGINSMFSFLTNAYLDAYAFCRDAELYRRKLGQAKEFMENILKNINIS